MVGGGNRRDESSFTVSNSNVFAALESLRKKKRSDKEKGSSKGGKGTSKAGGERNAKAEKQVFWAPAPLTVKSWADVDDEDDDDYYATTAPPQAIWAGSGLNAPEETDKPDIVEESESEDELVEEGDDDEEGHDHESEVHEDPEPPVLKAADASQAPKETERQLSKKERRKKELEELEAILADFGVNPKQKDEDEASDAPKEQKDGLLNGSPDKNDNPPMESKSAKKKKKKEKASREAKEPQDQSNSSDVPNGQGETAGVEVVEEDASIVDVKERLKRVASSKKKKSNKEMDGAARAAAVEAAARSKKLAAAKKKEKNHYNQLPIR